MQDAFRKNDLTRFSRRLDELRQALSRRDPLLTARNTGSTFTDSPTGQTAFLFSFWSRPISLAYPDYVATYQYEKTELSEFNQAAILYYFDTADGTPLEKRWISFSELPDGKFYNQAFQGYTGLELHRVLSDDQPGFQAAAVQLGGKPADFATVSFVFTILPCVPLRIVFWQGDEDFPSSYQLLFDASAAHYMPTDGYAILGSNLCRRIIEQYKNLKKRGE